MAGKKITINRKNKIVLSEDFFFIFLYLSTLITEEPIVDRSSLFYKPESFCALTPNTGKDYQRIWSLGGGYSNKLREPTNLIY